MTPTRGYRSALANKRTQPLKRLGFFVICGHPVVDFIPEPTLA